MTTTLLSIDPGLTTGFAIFHKGPVFTGTIPHADLGVQLRGLRRAYEPHQIVIERLPETLRPDLRKVQETIHLIFPNHHELLPGQWKPVAGKLVMPGHEKCSQHELDAYRMGRYWLYRNLGVSLTR